MVYRLMIDKSINDCKESGLGKIGCQLQLSASFTLQIACNCQSIRPFLSFSRRRQASAT